ncbi:hypothetical protein WBK31_13725 [Nonomuraea sp. N2-4H]|jgi:hypothetical protein|uniref:hypothetical protein n=1 Tax=unclassified Nonomuraea TaxID=2593643 RepID=UPI003249C8AF
MPRMPGRLAAVAAVAALAAGCGITGTGVRPVGEPVQGGLTGESGRLLRVYFVTPEGTWPVSRPVVAGDGVQEAVDALLAGPTADERARGLATRVPATKEQVRARTSGGRVELRLPWLVRDLPHLAVSQLVCTAAGGGGPVVEVYEPGMGDRAWEVRCDDHGTAVPAGGEGTS